MQTLQAERSNPSPVSSKPVAVSLNAPYEAREERSRYELCVEASKRVRWEIDRDVLRGRAFDFSQAFLPEGLTRMGELSFLGADEQRWLSQIQGRTYANTFGLVERFIGAKVLELSRHHWLGDQKALEALVRFSDEELKHQELFRRVERLMQPGFPPGYRFSAQPNEVAEAVLSKSTWAVLALTCHIELFTQAHYRESIEPNAALSPLFKDILFFHWKEEAQHAVLDELEWVREDQRLTGAQRDAAVDDFIALVGAVDGILQGQAAADAGYFLSTVSRTLDESQVAAVKASVLRAYRWQFILSGARHPRFTLLLSTLLGPEQLSRVVSALAPLEA